MTRLKVTTVEINVYEGMTPLVSGYLQAYALRDPSLRNAFGFDSYTTSRKTPRSEILKDLLQADSDIYAFSCYVWNMGLVRSLLPVLMEARPQARFLLGGPQVMQHADRYIAPDMERTIVCNGEGERTFESLLQQFISDRPDFGLVKGISFYRDGELITTDKEERIRDLDEIPSPFLAGYFDDDYYRMSVIETNRGCPFRCGFCYWGAANNDRVFRFDEDRVREEITWLARQDVPIIHIADANWGMLKRDIGLSQHIADCKREYMFPMAVIFAAAKNSPARVTETTRIFTEAGLVNTQPISMQSLDETSLDYVDRQNIKLSAYAELQDDLNERNIGSYIELIWPLPGETLDSFRRGIETLCERRASTIIVYAHLLLHNTPIYRDREKFGLSTRRAHDETAEAEIITATAEVSDAEFIEGIWYIYALNALHNTHSLHYLSAYLHHTGILSYRGLFCSFIEFAKTQPNHPFTRFCTKSIEEVRYYDFTNYPMIYHMVLHGERAGFSAMLSEFVRAQSWWADENARMLFEIDLLNKPFLYANTPIGVPEYEFGAIDVLEVEDRGYRLAVPARFGRLLSRYQEGIDGFEDGPSTIDLSISHPSINFIYNARRSVEDNADYCSGMITRVTSILPSWSMTPESAMSA